MSLGMSNRLASKDCLILLLYTMEQLDMTWTPYLVRAIETNSFIWRIRALRVAASFCLISTVVLIMIIILQSNSSNPLRVCDIPVSGSMSKSSSQYAHVVGLFVGITSILYI